MDKCSLQVSLSLLINRVVWNNRVSTVVTQCGQWDITVNIVAAEEIMQDIQGLFRGMFRLPRLAL